MEAHIELQVPVKVLVLAMVSACGRRSGQQFPVANILIDEFARPPHRGLRAAANGPEDRALTSSHPRNSPKNFASRMGNRFVTPKESK